MNAPSPRPAALASLMLLVLASCDPTSGRMVPFSFESGIQASAPATPHAFVTDTGWTVTLDTALVVVGPAYFFANPSTMALAPRPRPRPLERLYGWVMPSAHAHPGDEFFAGGEALGEWPDQWVMDAASPGPVVLGQTAGIEGRILSGSVLLQPPTAATALAHPALEGRTARFVGRAERHGVEVAFEVAFDYASTFAEQLAGGLPADVALSEGAVVSLNLELPAVFSGADFAEVAPGPVPEGHRLQQLLRINLRRASSWQLSGRSP